MIWKHSKNDNSIISSLDAPATKRSVLPMDSFGGQPLLNHGYSPLSTASSSSITRGTLWVRDLRSICEKLELNWSFLLRILLSHFQSRELQRCHKQAGRYISPGHHVADTTCTDTSNSCSHFFEFCVALFIGCLSKEERFILSGSKSLFLHCFCL